MRRALKYFALLMLTSLLGVAGFAGFIYIRAAKDSPLLTVKWEGLFIDRNFRDAGKSLNVCMGRQVFREGELYRSNVWFSGWACDRVGRPDVIYSLNFDPNRKEEYFCQGDDKKVVGRHFQSERLNDLEFLDTWKDPKAVVGICGFFRDALTEIGEGRKVLAHCDAGKDRTATFVAVLAALAAESIGPIDGHVLDAIECDYRRTKTLEPPKFGRMKAFIESLVAYGGVKNFLKERCGVTEEVADKAASRLLDERRISSSR